MDKKILAGIVEGMVEKVAAAQNVDAGMARALVGFALTKNADALVKAITAPTIQPAA
jgi:hypothetical protein